jgi:clathrin heavy chain
MQGDFDEAAESLCHDSNVYVSGDGKEYLKTFHASNPRLLTHVCNRFDYVEELIEHLYVNKLS